MGEQCDEVAMEAELAHKMAERKLSEDARNIINDVEWGLHG
ncbi:MAG: hypothetical protein U9N43_08245 [Euryarchaeota archaeon]|nr:hypothetical protein [Euryarchaeota archaeon]